MADNIRRIDGGLDIYTNGSRIGLTSASEPLADPQAVLHIVNEDAVTCGLRVSSHWSGSTEEPFQNNDNSLWEVFNNVESDSANRSWSGSFANAYNNIPEGVIDSGQRTGIIGWAVSAVAPDHVHAGTLNQQIGCHGAAGFQGEGSAETAVINSAIGVMGFIYNESEGATIQDARAGEFVSTASVGEVVNNIAVYASAAHGTKNNYAFFGNAGDIYSAGQIRVRDETTQSSSSVCARVAGNAYEFGHPDNNGYACNFGATWSSGEPFLAFCSEVDPVGNTFTTRGKPGTIITGSLEGALIFSRLSDPNASGQMPIENGRFDPDGHLSLSATPYLPTKTPASATAPGKIGEFCWDGDYLYVCVAEDTWKRAALSSW